MFRKLFKKSESRGAGASLDRDHSWELSAPPGRDRIAEALGTLLPAGPVIVLESNSIDPEVELRLREYVIPEALAIRPGIVWPRSQMLHVSATREALRAFADLIAGFPAPQICAHMYAYAGDALLLEWTDVFDDPMLLSGTMPEATVARFCDILGVTPMKEPPVG
jgi:hypothetical protein